MKTEDKSQNTDTSGFSTLLSFLALVSSSIPEVYEELENRTNFTLNDLLEEIKQGRLFSLETFNEKKVEIDSIISLTKSWDNGIIEGEEVFRYVDTLIYKEKNAFLKKTYSDIKQMLKESK